MEKLTKKDFSLISEYISHGTYRTIVRYKDIYAVANFKGTYEQLVKDAGLYCWHHEVAKFREAVSKLKDMGIDDFCQSEDDYYAIRWACDNNYKELVELLILNGASGVRAKKYAELNGYDDILELIIQSDIDRDIRINTGMKHVINYIGGEIVRGVNLKLDELEGTKNES